MSVILVQRKSDILGRSNLACLADVASINLTAGCGHGCIYCYTLGYANTPQDASVQVYANTATKLREELRRKRSPPRVVYFSSSSDLFQPIREVLDLALDVLSVLFEHQIRVSFLTKGRIPAEHMALLQAHAPLVEAQVGLITLEEPVHRLFEPKAALPAVRLEQITELVAAGIATSARLDPILPGVTDSETSLRQVCSALARTGITRLAAGTLFLRTAVVSSFRRKLRNSPILTPLLGAFAQAQPVVLRGAESSIRALPADARRIIFQRVQDVAAEFGLKARICACKNPDIAEGSCQIAGQQVAQGQNRKQLDLFRGEGR